LSKTNLRGLAVATAVIIAGGTVLATNASASQVDAGARSTVTVPVQRAAVSAQLSHDIAARNRAARIKAHQIAEKNRAARSKHAHVVAAKNRAARIAAARDRASRAATRRHLGTVGYSKWFAKDYMARKYGWGAGQFQCLDVMWYHESNWRTNADNHDNGYTWGIPQAMPGSKMASAGRDWRTNPETQIRWGLGYIKTTYGTPCSAWSFWQGHSWY